MSNLQKSTLMLTSLFAAVLPWCAVASPKPALSANAVFTNETTNVGSIQELDFRLFSLKSKIASLVPAFGIPSHRLYVDQLLDETVGSDSSERAFGASGQSSPRLLAAALTVSGRQPCQTRK
jgi:hypothetical protein